jgi:hypothetical protein
MNDDDQSDYEILRAAIEATMADPDRWDGDDAEPAILARYVEHLAAENAKLRAAQKASDAAWSTVYIRGGWALLTDRMSAECREAAADGVARHHWSDDVSGRPELPNLRWWRS